MKTAALHLVLVYYDGPEIFIAKDKFGVRYLSLAVPQDGSIRYASVALDERNYSLLLEGKINLRKILIQESAESGWFLSDPLREGFGGFELSLQSQTIPEGFLPESDFFFERLKLENSLLEELVAAKGRPIVSLRVEPPEAEHGSQIRANTLAALIIEFQKLVRHAKPRKAVKSASDDMIDYSLNALAFSSGSFKVYFESAGQLDLFGRNNLECALDFIEGSLADASDVEKVITKLKLARGHFVASLRRLLELLQANQSYLEMAWSRPGSNARGLVISKYAVAPLLEKLKESDHLSKEIKVFSGHFISASVSSGGWRLRTFPDGEEVSGKAIDPQQLSGVVIEKGLYSVTCEEVIEEDLVTGRERHILTLTGLSLVVE